LFAPIHSLDRRDVLPSMTQAAGILIFVAIAATLGVGSRVARIRHQPERRHAAWLWLAVGTAATWGFVTARDVFTWLENGMTLPNALAASALVSGIGLIAAACAYLIFGATFDFWADRSEE